MTERVRGVAILLAYYAPPAVGIAAQRIRGFVRHLPETGWDPIVLAPARVHYHQTRSDGEDEPWEGGRLERVPNPEISRWFRRLAGIGQPPGSEAGPVRELTPVGVGPLGGALRRFVREWIYIPDAQFMWIPGAARAVSEQVRAARGRPTVVFSTSVPFSAHFAARRAAGETGVPWVAEYRDPWSVAPPQFGRRSGLRQLVDTRLDHDLVAAASHLVVTSTTTANRYREAFPGATRRGVTVVRNGFDEVRDVSPPAPEGPMTLLYSGTLLHPSYAAPLLGALSRLWEAYPDSVFLDVFGPAEGWQAAGGREGTFLRLHGLVPSHEMPGHLASTSVPVLLQPDPAHVQYIAGKLYEYLGARRPVLAALPEECEAAALIRHHGELWRIHSLDEESCVSILLRLLEAHRAGRLQGASVPAGQVSELSRRAQVGRLGEVFDSVAGR